MSIRLPGIFLLVPLLCLLLWPQWAGAGEANVFIYHRFGDARYPSTNIDLEVFAAQLAWLQEHGRPVLGLGEVVKRLRAGQELPAGCTVLTVDDAFRTFLPGAMPLLRRYHYPVTLFVNTDSVGAPGYLDWQQLRGLVAEGVEIGNHTASHAYLLEARRGEGPVAWRQRVKGNIESAQRALQQHLGVTPTLFAYPYGEYSPALETLVKDLGFLGAVAQQSGVVWTGSDLYALPRFPMGGPYATLAGFRTKARMHALQVQVLAPASPIESGAGPPLLRLSIAGGAIRRDQLRCFVQGGNSCSVEAEPGADGVYLVQAQKPLEGRRNKYTVTAPGRRGGWYWFSQPWFRPDHPGGAGG